jgi:hypothetical protein
MTLDLAADSAIMVGDFGETIAFRADPASPPRSIIAVVNRYPIADASESPFAGNRPPTIHVRCRNHQSLGVAPLQVVPDHSELLVAFPQGTEPRWRPVLRIINHNAGTVLLEVQQ